jgi:4-amino-4-deoxy-L-arabinose transferase-like glycosyltransferase
MNTVFILIVVAVCGGMLFVTPSEAPGALAMCAVAALPTLIILARTPEQRTFLMRLFVLALVVRMILAVVIYVGHMEEFFGGDANTYDVFGQSLAEAWNGNEYHQAKYESFVASGATAWGMIYLVAAVYSVVGANMLAIQLINAAVGAATAIVVYYAAKTLFDNKRVSQVAAILVAFFPSLVLWSSQALKDGLIIMALALAILATLRLMEKVQRCM